MNDIELKGLLDHLRNLPKETEWAEFKHNNARPEEIGQYLSALSNAAALVGQPTAYIVWGVQDETHAMVGTTFRPHREKVGNQELESWLMFHLQPSIDFRFHESSHEDKTFVVLEIPACTHTPVRWKSFSFIRVGSYKKKLSDLPEKERSLWLKLSVDQVSFEQQKALQNATGETVLSLLNFSSYYDLTKQPLPSQTSQNLERLESERMVKSLPSGRFDITNFGAILLAKQLSAFPSVRRRAVRVIQYSGEDRTAGAREHVADSGYDCGFEALVTYINSQLPVNEHIATALRMTTPTYPGIAVRELVANAILHQDLTVSGVSPMVEIFTDRMEITNPGRPLIDPLRFVDEPPRSRNEDLAAFLRRVDVCEERGSGITRH